MVSAFPDPYAMPPPRRERRAAVARRGLFSSTMVGSAMWCGLLVGAAVIAARWPHRAPLEVPIPSVEFLPPPADIRAWREQARPAGGQAEPGVIRPVDVEPVLPAPDIAPTVSDVGPPSSDALPEGRSPVAATPHAPISVAPEEPAAYVDEMPEAYRRVEPEYPELAMQAGMDGVVRMEVVVARDGTVRTVRILEPGSLFDEAATRAALEWRFHPATVNGLPVTAKVGLTFRFRIR